MTLKCRLWCCSGGLDMSWFGVGGVVEWQAVGSVLDWGLFSAAGSSSGPLPGRAAGEHWPQWLAEAEMMGYSWLRLCFWVQGSCGYKHNLNTKKPSLFKNVVNEWGASRHCAPQNANWLTSPHKWPLMVHVCLLSLSFCVGVYVLSTLVYLSVTESIYLKLQGFLIM